MGSENLFHKRKRIEKRQRSIRAEKATILVVCEGTKSEKHYFDNFPVGKHQLVIEGKGRNTKSLIEYAIQKQKEYKKRKEPFDQVWAVFDKDGKREKG